MNEPRDILNIDEAAELLGVSVKTFNKVLHTENIPARKIGREWKFSRAALIQWVGSGRSQDFYEGQHGEGQNGHVAVEESSDARDDGEFRQTTITPPEKPRARRTAGWHIEMD